jgi:hypothetical protein
MPRKSLRNSYLFISDGSALSGALNLLNADTHTFDATATTYVAVKVGEGNISWTEARGITYKRDHGRLVSVDSTGQEVYVGEAIAGDESPCEVSFDIVFESYISSGTEVDPVSALKGTSTATKYANGTSKPTKIVEGDSGDLDDWTNADTIDTCAPWSVNLVAQFDPGCHADAQVEVLWFPRFRWDSLQFDISNGQISCQGKCSALKPVKLTTGFTDWTSY